MVPGGHVADHHGNEENGNPLCAFFEEFLVFLLKGLHPADAAADDDCRPGRGQDPLSRTRSPLRLLRQRRGPAGSKGRCRRCSFLSTMGVGSKSFKKSCDGNTHVFGVETVNFREPVAAGADALPGGGGIVSHRGDGAEPVMTTRFQHFSFDHMERQPETSSTCPEM